MICIGFYATKNLDFQRKKSTKINLILIYNHTHSFPKQLSKANLPVTRIYVITILSPTKFDFHAFLKNIFSQ